MPTEYRVLAAGESGTIIQGSGPTAETLTWEIENAGVSNPGPIIEFGPNDIWTVDRNFIARNSVWHWNGSLWKPVPMPEQYRNLGMITIWGSSSSNIVVGGYGGYVFHWDGSSWEAKPKPSGYSSHAFLYIHQAPNSGDLYALSSTAVFRYHNGEWLLSKSGLTINAADMWVTSGIPQDCAFISGRDLSSPYYARVYTWEPNSTTPNDGTLTLKYTYSSIYYTPTINCVHGISKDDWWFAYGNLNVNCTLFHWTGAAWRTHSPVLGYTWGNKINPPGRLFATGPHTCTMIDANNNYRGGNIWEGIWYDSGIDSIRGGDRYCFGSMTPSSITKGASGNLWYSGYNSGPMMIRRTVSGWESPLVGLELPFRSAHKISNNEIYACVGCGVMKYDGASWQPMKFERDYAAKFDNQDLYDVWFQNSNNGYAVGENGAAYWWNGSKWQNISPYTDSLWLTNLNYKHMYAVGDGGGGKANAVGKDGRAWVLDGSKTSDPDWSYWKAAVMYPEAGRPVTNLGFYKVSDTSVYFLVSNDVIRGSAQIQRFSPQVWHWDGSHTPSRWRLVYAWPLQGPYVYFPAPQAASQMSGASSSDVWVSGSGEYLQHGPIDDPASWVNLDPGAGPIGHTMIAIIEDASASNIAVCVANSMCVKNTTPPWGQTGDGFGVWPSIIANQITGNDWSSMYAWGEGVATRQWHDEPYEYFDPPFNTLPNPNYPGYWYWAVDYEAPYTDGNGVYWDHHGTTLVNTPGHVRCVHRIGSDYVCGGAIDFTATNDYTGSIYVGNPTSGGWTIISTGTNYPVVRIWGSSLSDLYLCLEDGYQYTNGGVYHYDGVSFTKISSLQHARTGCPVDGNAGSEYIALGYQHTYSGAWPGTDWNWEALWAGGTDGGGVEGGFLTKSIYTSGLRGYFGGGVVNPSPAMIGAAIGAGDVRFFDGNFFQRDPVASNSAATKVILDAVGSVTPNPIGGDQVVVQACGEDGAMVTYSPTNPYNLINDVSLPGLSSRDFYHLRYVSSVPSSPPIPETWYLGSGSGKVIIVSGGVHYASLQRWHIHNSGGMVAGFALGGDGGGGLLYEISIGEIVANRYASSGTINSVTDSTMPPMTPGIHAGKIIHIVAGAAAGDVRTVLTNAEKSFTVTEDFTAIPGAGSQFIVREVPSIEVVGDDSVDGIPHRAGAIYGLWRGRDSNENEIKAACGSRGRALTYNNTTEEWEYLPPPTGYDLRGCYAAATDDVYVCGVQSDDPISIWHWDGSKWEPPVGLPPLAGVSFYDCFGLDSDNVWVCGNGSYIAYWDGSTWTNIGAFGPSFRSYTRVWARDVDDVYVTNGDSVAHWDGATLTDLPHAWPGQTVWNVSTAYALNDRVFHNGEGYVCTFANTGVEPGTPGSYGYWAVDDFALTAIWGTEDRLYGYDADRDNAIYWDGSVWNEVTPAFSGDENQNAIYIEQNDQVILAGGETNLSNRFGGEIWKQGSWTQTAAITNAELFRVFGYSVPVPQPTTDDPLYNRPVTLVISHNMLRLIFNRDIAINEDLFNSENYRVTKVDPSSLAINVLAVQGAQTGGIEDVDGFVRSVDLVITPPTLDTFYLLEASGLSNTLGELVEDIVTSFIAHKAKSDAYRESFPSMFQLGTADTLMHVLLAMSIEDDKIGGKDNLIELPEGFRVLGRGYNLGSGVLGTMLIGGDE